MSYMTRDQFLKMQEEREKRNEGGFDGPRVGFFSLKNDGEEALVRFAYDDPSEFAVYTVHPIQNMFGRKFGNVDCLDGSGSCPLCDVGISKRQRFFIKLVEYTRDENGNIIATPKVWERPTSYMQTLANLFTEYGNISDCVFKVKRNGAKGDMQTSYSMMLANPTIYSPQLYPKDFSAFTNYTVLGSAILAKTREEMVDELRENGVDINGPETSVNTSTTYEITPSAPRRVQY